MHELIGYLPLEQDLANEFWSYESKSETETECSPKDLDDDETQRFMTDRMFDLSEIFSVESSEMDALVKQLPNNRCSPKDCDPQQQDCGSELQDPSFKETILSRRKRAVLNSQTAEEIFRLGVALALESRARGSTSAQLSRRSILVSQLYGISPKAVRDIWNR